MKKNDTEINTDINASTGLYQYQFIGSFIGNYNITINAEYLNETLQEITTINVIQTPINDTTEEPIKPEVK